MQEGKASSTDQVPRNLILCTHSDDIRDMDGVSVRNLRELLQRTGHDLLLMGAKGEGLVRYYLTGSRRMVFKGVAIRVHVRLGTKHYYYKTHI